MARVDEDWIDRSRRDIAARVARLGPPPDHRLMARSNGAASPRHARRFPLLTIDEIDLGREPVCLIDRLLSAAGLAIVFGLPKCGKSFLLSDALFHVAMERAWAGRAVLGGAVAYVSSEGVCGLKRRFVAMRRHYGVEGVGIPFAFIPGMPDLGHATEDADLLIATVQEWLATIGNPPLRAIAIDTLARAMNGARERHEGHERARRQR
jgi:RecA-family ATPase